MIKPKNIIMNMVILRAESPSELSIRNFFLKEIYKNEKILEIGPFNNPVLVNDKVKYFDVLNSEELKIRANSLNLDTTKIPNKIHFMDKFGDLKIVNQKFNNIFSSHCIEHQPNLIKHLNNVSNILKRKESII